MKSLYPGDGPNHTSLFVFSTIVRTSLFASRSAVVSAAVVLPYLRPTIQSAACHPECTVMIDHPLYKIVEAGLFEQLELIAMKLQQAMALFVSVAHTPESTL